MTSAPAPTAPADLRARAAELHRQADALPVWESRAVRATSAMLRAEARELVARARLAEQSAPVRRPLVTCQREYGA